MKRGQSRGVLVIGARRRRQGLGSFIARWFAELGVPVCAIVGTTDATVAQARRDLETSFGITCRGYTSLQDGLAAEQPWIAAICSPLQFHREHLLAVAVAGAHCLCEKPLWWSDGFSDLPDARCDAGGSEHELCSQTARIVDAFVGCGKYLGMVTQWPSTLPVFHQLHPQMQGKSVEQFEILLSPMISGAAMVPDAAPHVLSMLQALVGYGELGPARATFLNGPRDLQLEFDYHHGVGRTAVKCRFVTCERPPRPAGYAINGVWVHRQIKLPGYTIRFECEKTRRTIVLEDPLRMLVAQFLQGVDGGAEVDRRGLIESMHGLNKLTRATVAAAGRAP